MNSGEWRVKGHWVYQLFLRGGTPCNSSHSQDASEGWLKFDIILFDNQMFMFWGGGWNQKEKKFANHQ